MSDTLQEQCPPILFLIFNRPDLTLQAFARIREARPANLFVAADGPRPDQLGEVKLCNEARRVIKQVDWSCNVRTLYREQNLGCKNAVSEAISWFFTHVDEGIILEDDCIPHPTFFRFCQELLAYYRTEKSVMLIGGNNFQPGRKRSLDSYYFSAFGPIWGWATWRRAWQHNDPNLITWHELRETDWIKRFMLTREGVSLYKNKLDRVYSGDLDTWDYGWTYSRWLQNGLAVVPTCNLVTNVGFDGRATHTKQIGPGSFLEAEAMLFPLRHPAAIVRDKPADRFTVDHSYLGYPLPEDVGWLRYIYVRFRKKFPVRLRRRLDLLFNPKH